jgi:hypothetical protein
VGKHFFEFEGEAEIVKKSLLFSRFLENDTLSTTKVQFPGDVLAGEDCKRG